VNDSLIIRGAREHNLKGVDLDLPRDTMIVFTGLSGSGKSTLVKAVLGLVPLSGGSIEGLGAPPHAPRAVLPPRVTPPLQPVRAD